jgi:hypothetical protein
VHKCILAAMSPKFRAMFNIGFVEGNQKEIVLENAEPRIMKLLLRYFYTDEVSGQARGWGRQAQQGWPLLMASQLLSSLGIASGVKPRLSLVLAVCAGGCP